MRGKACCIPGPGWVLLWVLPGPWSGCGKGKLWNMCDRIRAARRQTLAECWLLNGHSLEVYWDTVGRSPGGVEEEHSADGKAPWNDSKLLHEHRIFAIPEDVLDDLEVSGAVWLWLIVPRSQCFFMNMGMSENALKR